MTMCQPYLSGAIDSRTAAVGRRFFPHLPKPQRVANDQQRRADAGRDGTQHRSRAERGKAAGRVSAREKARLLQRRRSRAPGNCGLCQKAPVA